MSNTRLISLHVPIEVVSEAERCAELENRSRSFVLNKWLKAGYDLLSTAINSELIPEVPVEAFEYLKTLHDSAEKICGADPEILRSADSAKKSLRREKKSVSAPPPPSALGESAEVEFSETFECEAFNDALAVDRIAGKPNEHAPTCRCYMCKPPREK